VNGALDLAKQTVAKDDVVDEYFNIIKREITLVFKSDTENIDSATDYLMIAKYLERIADHAVNICEWVGFSKTGKYKGVRVF
jgi:phosphate transport system protein